MTSEGVGETIPDKVWKRERDIWGKPWQNTNAIGMWVDVKFRCKANAYEKDQKGIRGERKTVFSKEGWNILNNRKT